MWKWILKRVKLKTPPGDQSVLSTHYMQVYAQGDFLTIWVFDQVTHECILERILTKDELIG